MNLDFRDLWLSLSALNRVFLLFFSCVFFYTLWLSSFVCYRLHALKKQRARGASEPSPTALRDLRRRVGTLRQLHLFTLYFVWLCIVRGIPHAFDTLGTSRTWPIAEWLQNLAFLFDFYAPIFLALLVLHSLQWIVSWRA